MKRTLSRHTAQIFITYTSQHFDSFPYYYYGFLSRALGIKSLFLIQALWNKDPDSDTVLEIRSASWYFETPPTVNPNKQQQHQKTILLPNAVQWSMFSMYLILQQLSIYDCIFFQYFESAIRWTLFAPPELNNQAL